MPRTSRLARTSQPVQAFLRTESSSTVLLLAATVLALVWSNGPLAGTYEWFWSLPFDVELGGLRLHLDLRHWVNDGLMALFFFVIGVEAAREFTVGEMRDRRKIFVPLVAALGGVVVPAAVYLAFNAGGPAAVGWGVPVAADTAFVLGMLTLVGPRCPVPLRVFLLTLMVVDDVLAIGIVAVVYTDEVDLVALTGAVVLFGCVLVLRRFGVHWAPGYVLLAMLIWLCTVESGVHPTVIGLALGVLVQTYEPPDADVLHAQELVHRFTREPTPERGSAATRAVRAAIPPNERLQLLLHPWTSYLIVPLFALANAGVPLSPSALAEAATSPVTLGVAAGLGLGKLAGISLGSWAGLRTRLGILPGSLVWGQLAGGAALTGMGFTVSLFISELAFSEQAALRDQAKIGIVAGSLLAALLGRMIFWLAWSRGAVCAPPPKPGEPAPQQRPSVLAEPVGDRDHVLGGPDAAITLVEYADYECPYCGQLRSVLDELFDRYGDQVRYVFRHFPLDEVHPNARRAALVAEAAAARGRFWDMHERLFDHQRQLDRDGLVRQAVAVGLPREAVTGDAVLSHADRVAADEESAAASGVAGTPTLFVNGRRYRGAHDVAGLTEAIEDELGR